MFQLVPPPRSAEVSSHIQCYEVAELRMGAVNICTGTGWRWNKWQKSLKQWRGDVDEGCVNGWGWGRNCVPMQLDNV